MISPYIKRLPSKKSVMAIVAAAITSIGMVAPGWADEEKVLNIYNWSDYIAPDTVANFEKQTGIKVRYDNFDSNETLHAKLVAGKTGYDVVVPSSNWAKIQIQGGLLKKLDRSKLTNWGNLDPAILEQMAKLDPGNQYLVNWLWGYTTVGINVDKVKKALGNEPLPDNVWELVFNPKYADKLKSCGFSMLDSGEDITDAALIYQGKNPFTKDVADYNDAFAMLAKIRPDVTLFSSSGYINDMANGSICVALGWSGDMNIARQRAIDNKSGQNIQVLIPKAGAVLFFDTMAIPADAPHPENALLWINYILQPKVDASLTNSVFYANPNKASLEFVKPELAHNETLFLNDKDKAAMFPPQAISNDIRRTITRLYTRFKTGL